jgi:6-pyruvoyltetrahydropterin/6-carboxytetrahydropterin synthase
MKLTRIYRFEAAHRLVSNQLGDAENDRVYGKCSRRGGHGHNYEVEVTLEGDPDRRSGMLMSRHDMDARVERALVSRVDHRNLNDVVEDREVTTGENLSTLFWTWLAPEFASSPRLARVRVVETPRNRFETTGNEGKRT